MRERSMWLAEKHYRVIGPLRQLHLQPAEHADLARAVTELRFLVEKYSA